MHFIQIKFPCLELQNMIKDINNKTFYYPMGIRKPLLRYGDEVKPSLKMQEHKSNLRE